MAKRKLAIVCNSPNPDLQAYFRNSIDYVSSSLDLLILKNRHISVNARGADARNISYGKKAFGSLWFFYEVIIAFVVFFRCFSNWHVIHFTTAAVANLPLSFLLKIKGAKQIYTIHDVKPHPGLKSKFIDLYNRLIIGFLADEILLHSQGSSQYLKAYSKTIRTSHIPLGGFDMIRPAHENSDYFLFFGRFDQYKGLENIIKIARACPEEQFVVAGKGSSPYLEGLKALPNVRLINRFIEDSEIPGLFAGARATLLPYTSATQSGVVVLSYAHGIPVIVTDVGCLSEYVSEQTGHVHVKIDGIIELILSKTPEYWQSMRSKVIQTYEDEFSWQALENKYINFYTDRMGLRD